MVAIVWLSMMRIKSQLQIAQIRFMAQFMEEKARFPQGNSMGEDTIIQKVTPAMPSRSDRPG
jgi:hypothetical protein